MFRLGTPHFLNLRSTLPAEMLQHLKTAVPLLIAEKLLVSRVDLLTLGPESVFAFFWLFFSAVGILYNWTVWSSSIVLSVLYDLVCPGKLELSLCFTFFVCVCIHSCEIREVH
jgi:hypothetical protein